MIKTYLPVKKIEGKARIRGLWRNSQGRLFYDYLRKASIEASQLPFVKRHYRQEAIFYTDKGRAFIWYKESKVEGLKYQRYFDYDRGKAGLKDFIKDLIKTFGGVTIYIRQENYLFEVWT